MLPSEEEQVPLKFSIHDEIEQVLNFGDDYDDDEDLDSSETFARLRPSERKEAIAAERLSVRLLAIADEDSDEEDRIVRESLRIPLSRSTSSLSVSPSFRRRVSSSRLDAFAALDEEESEKVVKRHVWTMVALAILGLILLIAIGLYAGVKVVGPPNLPVGPYVLVERQEGASFFDYYTFYEGRDSVGSNGFNIYVNMQAAQQKGLMNITEEVDELDVYKRKRRLDRDLQRLEEPLTEPFVYMRSSATEAGPRNSIRLEGNRRFNRGLFIIDLRHMPAGCGVWPAFWLTDEANWPINGEIDIVEGVNYQSEAKTALHATDGCAMNDIPLGTMTGIWDTAQGIPDAKTGIPDMTLRYATNCFVYDPHQWINQGCVAVDANGGTLGQPLNENGGGVYALEWDPINKHIRTWVFTPHSSVPDNLVDAIRTASFDSEYQVVPDPDQWPLPYGFFAIGDGTDCPESHFRHMRLVFNLAFCGSVAGNRYQMDCKEQAKKFDTCNEWIKSDPSELDEAYWKLRGVYVYERRWERTWLN